METNDLNDCLHKIQKLKISALDTSVAATKVARKLANKYFNLGRYDKAEQQYSVGSVHVVCVKADLVDAILRKGHYDEAKHMTQDLYIEALRSDVSGGAKFQRAMRVLALSLGYLKQNARKEELLKQLVQIRLTSLGPRHVDTLAVLRHLCQSMQSGGRCSESEKLLRVALELGATSHTLSVQGKCVISRELAFALKYQKRYRESETLYRRTFDVAEKSLGVEHRRLWVADLAFAGCWRHKEASKRS